MKVLVVGESCVDTFRYVKCTRQSPEAPIPVLQPLHERSNPGMAGNVVRNFKELGVQVDVLTNLNWESIKKIRYVDENTGHYFVRIDENDDKYGSIDQIINIYTEAEDIRKNQYDAIVISDYDKGFLWSDDIEQLGQLASLSVLDTKKLLDFSLESISFVKINQHEYERTFNYLNDDYGDKFIITAGKQGAFYNKVQFFVEETETKDLSGAGDSFLCGFVYWFIKTKNIYESINFANVCATSVVKQKGVSVIDKNFVLNKGWKL